MKRWIWPTIIVVVAAIVGVGMAIWSMHQPPRPAFGPGNIVGRVDGTVFRPIRCYDDVMIAGSNVPIHRVWDARSDGFCNAADAPQIYVGPYFSGKPGSTNLEPAKP